MVYHGVIFNIINSFRTFDAFLPGSLLNHQVLTRNPIITFKEIHVVPGCLKTS